MAMQVPLRMRTSATMAAADGVWIRFRSRTSPKQPAGFKSPDVISISNEERE